jgi:pyruvate formate lyase activating enzyme
VSDLQGIVFDIQRFSIHDGPGIRTTVFLKGCPLSCAWCHNPESQSPEPELAWWSARCIACGTCLAACPNGAIRREPPGGALATDRSRCTVCGTCADACPAEARERIGVARTVAEVMDEVRRDLPFYAASGGGVTISGGEPLAQPRFLEALLRAARAEGIHTTLDTSGHAPWTVLDAVRGLVDLFLYDLKRADDDGHRRWTGVSNATLLDNLRALSARGHRIVVRVPVIAGVNEDPVAADAIAALAAGLPGVERIELLPGHRYAGGKYERLGRRAPDVGAVPDERLGAIAERMRRHAVAVRAGA